MVEWKQLSRDEQIACFFVLLDVGLSLIGVSLIIMNCLYGYPNILFANLVAIPAIICLAIGVAFFLKAEGQVG